MALYYTGQILSNRVGALGRKVNDIKLLSAGELSDSKIEEVIKLRESVDGAYSGHAELAIPRATRPPGCAKTGIKLCPGPVRGII